ncbi:AhpC/TSA antioxidant enzyme-domain-containing protein [Vararia minispora EC-137]|uniref:AhpC/TSA antioxidant enzyme-domain-containing protein n=1 Tax=Vararia minispora EC-137 TaxID=1314806 RepID=A0ACB8QGV1_9AGAM|nr:AhpC/TSA antioxidant enzyme-domain-containing protein [Vararia minispora EC-137]
MSSDAQVIDTNKLGEIAKFEVFDTTGEKVKFGSLFEDQKTVVIFIRHFFCGSCMQYVSALAKVRPEALNDVGVKIVLIGCGKWNLIQNYKAETGFANDVYANPDRTLYNALNMTYNLNLTPAGQRKASYVQLGMITNVVRSLKWAILKNPTNLTKGGPAAQNGGDFVLGPGQICHFAHIMQHTEDHVEVATLMEKAGVPYP